MFEINLNSATAHEIAEAVELRAVHLDGTQTVSAAHNNVTILVRAICECLAELRDRGHLEITWGGISECFNAATCLGLANNANITHGARFELLKLLSQGGAHGQKEGAELDQIFSFIDKSSLKQFYVH